jgi:hypothetical protein
MLDMSMKENRGEKNDLALSSLLTVLVFVVRLTRENPCQIAQTALVQLNNSNSVQKNKPNLLATMTIRPLSNPQLTNHVGYSMQNRTAEVFFSFSKRSIKDRIFIIKGDNENTPVFTNNKTKAEDRRLMLAF